VLIVHADPSLRAHLQHHRLIGVIGGGHILDTLRDAMATIQEQRVLSASGSSTVRGEHRQ
jgi:hypothetical protein